MTLQLSFADLPTQASPLTLDQKFHAFHKANPQVYTDLRRMVLAAARRGEKHGMKYFFEMLRSAAPGTAPTKEEPYKLNNSYTPHYATMLMDREPELAGYFKSRSRRTAVTRQAVLSGLEKVTA